MTPPATAQAALDAVLPLRTIVAGCRGVTDYRFVERAIEECGWPIGELVSGGALGVDELGERWAKRNNVPVKLFEADWDTFGNKAGPIRNGQMAAYAQALVACWDGRSRGTGDMIRQASARRLRVHISYF